MSRIQRMSMVGYLMQMLLDAFKGITTEIACKELVPSELKRKSPRLHASVIYGRKVFKSVLH